MRKSLRTGSHRQMYPKYLIPFPTATAHSTLFEAPVFCGKKIVDSQREDVYLFIVCLLLLFAIYITSVSGNILLFIIDLFELFPSWRSLILTTILQVMVL